jgi:limonene-1,2-epoxide hydrolase
VPADTDPESVVKGLLDAVHRHDPDEIAASFTDDAVCQLVPGSRLEGKEAIRGLFAQFAGMMSEARIDVHHQIAADGVVMQERTDTLSVGDNEMTIRVCGVFEVENGLVKAWRDYYLDPMPAMPA